jgi:hypothetical protein
MTRTVAWEACVGVMGEVRGMRRVILVVVAVVLSVVSVDGCDKGACQVSLFLTKAPATLSCRPSKRFVFR